LDLQQTYAEQAGGRGARASPLSWEHIGFSGDFLWNRTGATALHRRPLNLRRDRIAM
jgi:hypothetical protein